MKKIKMILLIALFISCRREGKTNNIELYLLYNTNDSTIHQTVYLQIGLTQLGNGRFLMEEKVFDKTEALPQFGGNFSRILLFEKDQVTQEFYLPNDENCDSLKVDTLSYLFLTTGRDTMWNSFDDIKYGRCSEFQLLWRYKFQNLLKSTSEEVILTQKRAENPGFQNTYIYDKKNFKLKEVRYVRDHKYYNFEPKHYSKYITFNPSILK
jgi:hypothetical protein